MNIRRISKSFDVLNIGNIFKVNSDINNNLYLKIGSASSIYKAFNLTMNQMSTCEDLDLSDVKNTNHELIYYPMDNHNRYRHCSRFEDVKIGEVFVRLYDKRSYIFIKLKEPSIDHILPDFNVFNLSTNQLEFINFDEKIMFVECVLEYED